MDTKPLTKAAQKWVPLLNHELLVEWRYRVWRVKLLEISPSGKHLRFQDMEDQSVQWCKRTEVSMEEILGEPVVEPPPSEATLKDREELALAEKAHEARLLEMMRNARPPEIGSKDHE